MFLVVFGILQILSLPAFAQSGVDACLPLLISYQPISGDEANPLAAEYATADASRKKQILNRFVHAYVPLARTAARKVHRANRRVDLEDLEQEALMSLSDALRTFDQEKGNFFGHAKRRMSAATEQLASDYWSDSGVITSTKFAEWYYFNRGKISRELESKGQEFDPEEVAKIYNTRLSVNGSSLPRVDADSVAEVEASYALRSPLSLSAPIQRVNSSNDGGTLVDVLEGSQTSALDLIEQKRVQAWVAAATALFVKKLAPFEKEIFRDRIVPLFSGDEAEALTLEVLGERNQVSRERARVVQNKVIQKFKKFLLRSAPVQLDH